MARWDRSKEKSLKSVEDLEGAIAEIKADKVGALFGTPKDRTNALARLRAKLKTAKKKEGTPKKSERKRRKKTSKVTPVDELVAILTYLETQLQRLEFDKVDKLGYVTYFYSKANVLETQSKLKLDAAGIAGLLLENYKMRWKEEPAYFTVMDKNKAVLIGFGPVSQDSTF